MVKKKLMLCVCVFSLSLHVQSYSSFSFTSFLTEILNTFRLYAVLNALHFHFIFSKKLIFL